MARLHAQAPGWRERYWHLVFLPTYKEPVNIIDATLRQIAKSTYPCDRIMIVLAGEERDREKFEANAELMKKKYGNVFGHFFVTVHPTGLPDEIPGKGSNLNYSGRRIQAELDRLGIQYENVIASSLDVDTVVHPQYFAHLTHSYATVEHPMRASYQPVVVFNNIWESPAPVRISAFEPRFGCWASWRVPTSLTFSSHSMPFKMLVDVGFWEKIWSPRTRVFSSRESGATPATTAWSRCTPVSMDAVAGESYWEFEGAVQTATALGVGRGAFSLHCGAYLRDRRIAFRKACGSCGIHMEGMFTWATAPILSFNGLVTLRWPRAAQ